MNYFAKVMQPLMQPRIEVVIKAFCAKSMFCLCMRKWIGMIACGNKVPRLVHRALQFFSLKNMKSPLIISFLILASLFNNVKIFLDQSLMPQTLIQESTLQTQTMVDLDILDQRYSNSNAMLTLHKR